MLGPPPAYGTFENYGVAKSSTNLYYSCWRSIYEYLVWGTPQYTTNVHHCAFQPTSCDRFRIGIMSMWDSGYHCPDLNIHGHFSLAGKGSPVEAFLCIVDFLLYIYPSRRIFWSPCDFHSCHKNELLIGRTLTIFITLHVTLAACTFLAYSKWTAQLFYHGIQVAAMEASQLHLSNQYLWSHNI